MITKAVMTKLLFRGSIGLIGFVALVTIIFFIVNHKAPVKAKAQTVSETPIPTVAPGPDPNLPINCKWMYYKGVCFQTEQQMQAYNWNGPTPAITYSFPSPTPSQSVPTQGEDTPTPTQTIYQCTCTGNNCTKL